LSNQIDRKTGNQIVHALEKAKAYGRELKAKREEGVWRQLDGSHDLINLLSTLTKNELDTIRKTLDIKGISTLKKNELIHELAKAIPILFHINLTRLDQERYDLLQRLVTDNKVIITNSEYTVSQIESLRSFGMVFAGHDQGTRFLTMPQELRELFPSKDDLKLSEMIRRNTEWIRLTHGMLYYYGVMDTARVVDMIHTLTKQVVNFREFLYVFSYANEYHKKTRFCAYGLKDNRVFDEKKVIEEHINRPDVDFYPFTKKQLFHAGNTNFVDQTPELDRLFRFLNRFYELNELEINTMKDEIITLINQEIDTASLMEFLQTRFEFRSFEFVQQVMGMLVEIHNTTRMWVLKGYSPNELFREERKHLKPLPAKAYSHSSKLDSNVIELDSRTKVGRNDPCSCGSGKKFKKCCGK
jgi:hypothetical protein